MSVEKALEATMKELGAAEAAPEPTAEQEQVSEPVKAEGGEEVTDESSSESDAEAKASEEGTEQTTDPVQPIADAVVKKALENAANKHGRPQPENTPPQTGAKEGESAAQAPRTGPRSIEEVNLNDKKDVESWVKEIASYAVSEAVTPIAKQNALREADLELRKLVQDHPDSHKYGTAMAKLIEAHPNMPLEHAYRIASYDANKAAGKQEAYKSMEKKKAATLVQSTAKKPPESAKVAKSSREAVLMAMEEHGA